MKEKRERRHIKHWVSPKWAAMLIKGEVKSITQVHMNGEIRHESWWAKRKIPEETIRAAKAELTGFNSLMLRAEALEELELGVEVPFKAAGHLVRAEMSTTRRQLQG